MFFLSSIDGKTYRESLPIASYEAARPSTRGVCMYGYTNHRAEQNPK